MTDPDRALDRHEAELVAQTERLEDQTSGQLADLIKRLRTRRDRAQRMIRTRARAGARRGEKKPDPGAEAKKAALVDAISKVDAEIKARSSPDYLAKKATSHLRQAVERKAEGPHRDGPDTHGINDGPAETPNTDIAPSGALHAEGHRVALGRSMGRRS